MPRFGRTHWQAPPELSAEFFGPHGLRLDEWLRDGCAEIVKTGPHRTVYRLRLESGLYYLKHFRCGDAKARLQNLARSCKARLEERNATLVAAAGVPTVETVALGWERRGALVADSFLITRGLENVAPLDEWLDANSSVIRSEIRQQLAVELGRLVARLHAARLVHRDLHSGNVLCRTEAKDRLALWLIDVHALHRTRRPLSVRTRLQNIALLAHSLHQILSRTDQLRFFRTYWKSASPTAKSLSESFAAAVRRASAFCHQFNLRAWNKADRKWARGNRRLIIADRDQIRCRGVASIGRARLAEIRDNPESLLTAELSGVVTRLYQAHGPRSVGLESIDGHSVVRHVWETAHALLRRGIDTPRPLLFVETGSGGRSTQWLLTECVPDAVPLLTFLRNDLPALSANQQNEWVRRYTRRLADQVQRLHECGFTHRRLIAENLLVSRNPTECRVWLLQPEQVRRRQLSPVERWNNLAVLEQSLRTTPFARNTLRLRFLRRYLGPTGATGGLPASADVEKTKTRADKPPVAPASWTSFHKLLFEPARRPNTKLDWKKIWRGIQEHGDAPQSTPTKRRPSWNRVTQWLSTRRVGYALRFWILVVVCLLAGCQATQKTVSLPRRHSLHNDQLLVLSDVRLPRDHELIRDLAKLRKEISETLELPLQTQQVVVYLFGDELRYQQYLHTTYPQLPPRRAYFVGTAKELAVYTYWGERIQEDLRHEYTHGILHSCLRDVPLWLDEGLAEYFEGAGPPGKVNPEYAERLTVALSNGWRPDLERLEQLESVAQMQRADYQEAWAWVHFMLHDSPEAKAVLLDYLHELRTTHAAGQLSARLDKAVPHARDRFVNYLATLQTNGRLLGAL